MPISLDDKIEENIPSMNRYFSKPVKTKMSFHRNSKDTT